MKTMNEKRFQTVTMEHLIATKPAFAKYAGFHYWPVPNPCADNDELATMGERLMFKHGSATQPDSKVFFAAKGILHAGWVLGIVDMAACSLVADPVDLNS